MSNVTRLPNAPLTKEDMHNTVDDTDVCVVFGWKGNDLVMTTMETDTAQVNLWLDMVKQLLIEATRSAE